MFSFWVVAHADGQYVGALKEFRQLISAPLLEAALEPREVAAEEIDTPSLVRAATPRCIYGAGTSRESGVPFDRRR